MGRGKFLSGAAMALLFVAGATPAVAGTNTELLKRLHEKGILTDDEYAQLVQEDAAVPAAVTTTSGRPAVTVADSGVGFNVGDVTVKISGSVNGFYTHENGQAAGPNTAVVGGVVPVGGNSSAIRNGLLPGFLKFDVTTNQGGWDVGAHFGMYPGINSVNYSAGGGANSPGFPAALQTAGIDFRQTYMTFGRAGMGEFKIGRDIGLFGSEAILNDITLLSIGSTGGNVAPSNTSLGRIGVGYIYTDFQPQITYTTPKLGGFQVSAGVFEPLQSLTGPGETSKSPGFQGKIVYDAKLGGVSAHAWVSGITQKHNRVDGVSYTGSGFDVGSKFGFGPIALLGYYYNASGLGTTALNLFDTDAFGNKRDSDGFYLQGTATLGKFMLGGSYGESKLHYANNADAIANPELVSKNSSWVGQARYGLTPWVTLIGEYINTKAKAHNGNEADSDVVAVGGILFF